MDGRAESILPSSGCRIGVGRDLNDWRANRQMGMADDEVPGRSLFEIGLHFSHARIFDGAVIKARQHS